MNVEEFQEEKLCARCGHSEGRHKTAGGFCKHCPCDGFVEEKEHTDGKDCWCHPEVIFMADNGNKVWVHKGAGEELAPAEVIAQAIADAIANKGD